MIKVKKLEKRKAMMKLLTMANCTLASETRETKNWKSESRSKAEGKMPLVVQVAALVPDNVRLCVLTHLLKNMKMFTHL